MARSSLPPGFQARQAPGRAPAAKRRARRLPTRALAPFMRSLATLIAARLHLLSALRTSAQESSDARLRQSVAAIVARLERGQAFSEALRQEGDRFPPLVAELVRTAEETGELAPVLLRLSADLERSAETQRKIRSGLTYPLFVLAIAGGATLFMLLVVVPTFADLYRDFGQELPLPTTVLLGVSQVLRGYAWLLAVGLVALGYGAYRAWHHVPWQLRRDSALLRLPFAGKLLALGLSARFCHTLGTLLASGVHLTTALRATAAASGSAALARDTERLLAAVTRGGGLSEALGRSGSARVFSPTVRQMVTAGEESSELAPMLLGLSAHMDAELSAQVDRLTSLIEPVMIVVIGVILGGILIALYLPMFDLATTVR